MRILKSLGLVVAGGLYVFLVIKIPLVELAWVLGSLFFGGLFCWGYFSLFNPKG